MYWDLFSCDILARDAEGKFAVQTDHRTAEEINSEKNYSIVFGTARMLVPFSMGAGKVVFSFKHEPPKWYLELLGAVAELAGVKGYYEVNDSRAAFPVGRIDVEELINKAMQEIASKYEPNTNSIIKIYEEHRAEDEYSVDYNAVVDMAAVAGELIKRKLSENEAVCRWVIDLKNYKFIVLYSKKSKKGWTSILHGSKGNWIDLLYKAFKALKGEEKIDDFLALVETITKT